MPTNSGDDGAATSTTKQPSAFNVSKHDQLPDHLYFWTREEWIGEVPEEQVKLHLEFDNTCAVLRARFLPKSRESFDAEFTRLLKLAHATFSGDSAQVGPGYANLKAYQEELVRQEAPAIKNAYLKELAFSALLASIMILIVSALIRYGLYYGELHGYVETATTRDGTTNNSVLRSLQWNREYSPFHFGVLLASTMWGIWLSFVVRNMEFRFEQLQHVEADLMKPWSRLLAFGLLALILALFFQMGIVVVSIGGVSTSQISDNLLVAVFVGLGLGFTDKALPGEVKRRYEEFFQSAKRSGEK